MERSHDLAPPSVRAAVGWAGHAAAPRWIGVVPFEAGRGIERASWTRSPDTRPPPWLTLPTWNRYDAVARIDHASGRVVIEADDDASARRLATALAGALDDARDPRPAVRAASLVAEGPTEPDQAHVARVREVLRLIARGDVYQVNLARQLTYALRGDPLDAFTSVFRASPSPYGFYADLDDASGVIVAGSSPELSLEVRGGHLRTAPMKGTRPRGLDAEEDRAQAVALDHDPKERAELTMATDLHRNDLGRVAVTGSVRVLGAPRVRAGRTVWSRSAEVVARVDGVSLPDIFRAVLPCGSVTGAPKVRAMEVIATLEPFRRGLYTGAFGYVGRDGAVTLAMAIRTLEIKDRRVARYCTGGGIVMDSDPERELDETRWKAAQLAPLLAAGKLARGASGA